MKSLELQGLTKSFGGLRAVDDVSFHVDAGEFVGLIGPNGSGKSTLFNLIAGTLPQDAGRVLLDGRPIQNADPATVFDGGLVRSFQIPRLFGGMTVLENVLVAARGQRGERLSHVLASRRWHRQERELAERAMETLRFLDIDHVARNRATDLSGGQMKLLELARLLVADPAVLLLDEPAAGVVPSLAETIFERLARYRRETGLTLLVIEHRLEVLFDAADRVLAMNTGRLVADGEPERVANDPAVVEAYFGSGEGAA